MKHNGLTPFEELHGKLVEAQQDRILRPFDPGGLNWVDYEKLVMFGEVNRIRLRHDLPLLAYQEIERVEQMAAGHFDYTKKFALYCSELAVNEDLTRVRFV